MDSILKSYWKTILGLENGGFYGPAAIYCGSYLERMLQLFASVEISENFETFDLFEIIELYGYSNSHYIRRLRNTIHPSNFKEISKNEYFKSKGILIKIMDDLGFDLINLI